MCAYFSFGCSLLARTMNSDTPKAVAGFAIAVFASSSSLLPGRIVRTSSAVEPSLIPSISGIVAAVSEQLDFGSCSLVFLASLPWFALAFALVLAFPSPVAEEVSNLHAQARNTTRAVDKISGFIVGIMPRFDTR